MVDSRAKGARGELDAAKYLNDKTGLNFKRVPMSGALDAVHGLKGDLYLVNSPNKYCIEIKNYADDHISSKILTDKTPQIQTWWEQTIREAAQINKEPLLIFKFTRSKWFVAYKDMPTADYNHMYVSVNGHEFFTAKLDDWLTNEQPKFV